MYQSRENCISIILHPSPHLSAALEILLYFLHLPSHSFGLRILKYIYIYWFIWLHCVLVAACRIFLVVGCKLSCSMGDLTPWRGIEPVSWEHGFLATGLSGKSLGVRILKYWISVVVQWWRLRASREYGFNPSSEKFCMLCGAAKK